MGFWLMESPWPERLIQGPVTWRKERRGLHSGATRPELLREVWTGHVLLQVCTHGLNSGVPLVGERWPEQW